MNCDGAVIFDGVWEVAFLDCVGGYEFAREFGATVPGEAGALLVLGGHGNRVVVSRGPVMVLCVPT